MNTPVIYLTADANPSTVNRAKLAEPLGYILKPFNPEELRTTIETALYQFHKIQQRANEALQQAERRYQLLFENALEGIYQSSPDGRFLAANPALARMFGYDSPAELLSSVTNIERQLYVQSGRRKDFERILHEMGAARRFESRVRRKDGTEIWISENACAVRDESGHLLYYEAFAEDISESRRVEAAIRESENKYRALIETTDTGYVILDSEGRVLDANPGYVRLTGHGALEEILDRRITEWTAQHDLARNAAEVRKCLERGFVRNLEIDYVNREGVCVPIEINGTALRTADGVKIVTLCRDITARKQAEEVLRQSEEKFRVLFETSRDAIMLLDRTGFLDCNQATLDIFGCASRDRFISKHPCELSPPRQLDGSDSFTAAQAHIEAAYAVGSQFFEWLHKRTDGTVFFAEVLLSRFELHGKTVLQAVVRDITTRKRAEERLRDSEALYHSLVENLPQNVFRKDVQGRFTFVNRRFCQTTGRKMEEILGKTDFDFYPAELATKYRNDDCRIMETGEIVETTEEHQAPGSPRTYVRVAKSPLRDAQGNVIGVQGIFWDITESRRVGEQLRKLSLAVEQSPASVVITDPQGNIEYINHKFAEVTGYTLEEVIGKNPRVLKSGETPPQRYRELWETITAGREWHGEFHNKKKNGELFWESAIVTPIKNQSGDATHFLAIKEDITERKRTEQELRESEARFRSLTDAAQDAIIMMDPEGRISFWNKAAERFFGYTRTEVLCKPLHEVIAPSHYLPTWQKGLQQFQKTGEGAALGKTLELQAKRKDESIFPIELSVSAVGLSGEWHAIGIIRDISQRKRAEEQQAMMEIQLRQAMKLEAIGQLAAGIAHEINTPTQYVGDNIRFLQDAFADMSKALKSYDRLLQTNRQGAVAPQFVEEVEAAIQEVDLGYLNEEIPRAIAQSLEGVGRVATIVKAMKEFSHPGVEEKQAIDLNHAIESTVTVCRNEWKYVAEMVTEFDPDLPPVPCLPGELNQVILNLIINASHAIADAVGGGENGKGTITVRTRHDSNWAEIRVSDTGTGIPEEHRKKIFTPFFTTKEVGKGTGQGLAISHSVVVGKHGGTIEFETELGKGTTFIIRLPLDLDLSCRKRVP
jgi:PAS domain S-box-containing protein